MKAVRSHDWYGNVNFLKVDIGSGYLTFKVFWRRDRMARRALLLRQGVGAAEKDPITRFTRFPRSSARTSHGNHALLAESLPAG
jgi:hypothetical protein